MQGVDLIYTLLQFLSMTCPPVKMKVRDVYDAQTIKGRRQIAETQLHLLHLATEAAIDIAEDGYQHPYHNEHDGCYAERPVADTEMCNHPCQFRQQIDDMRQKYQQHCNNTYSNQ